MSKHLVAVYGSLRKGMGNHRLLQTDGVSFVGFGSVKGTLRAPGADIGQRAGFPYITLDTLAEGADTTQVEVYAVDDQCFERLDQLEGYPNFYDRRQVDVEGVDGKAWVYHYEKGVSIPVVPGGDWSKFKSNADCGC
ncbi:gamma-glutamyl cyclotransferase [Alcaligenes phage vB_Af_QDWS535]|nr:gamma-glutamyl cyclotransferase [Alcaligenes phage vB_Af_QDWS535]